MLPENVTKMLHSIAKSVGFSDYKIETKAGSNHGDNFLSVMIAVTISGTKVHQQIEHLHLICKMESENYFRNQQFRIDFAFKREIYMYSTVLPALIRFQQEKGLSVADSFLSIPKVYVSECDEMNGSYVLIMEDLRSKRYEMWPKVKMIPLDHELLVMRELGKFHAISIAMQDQRPNDFEEFTQMNDMYMDLINGGNFSLFINETLEKSAEVLKEPAHKMLLENLRKTYVTDMRKLLSKPSKFAVIGHGDCWNNNYLFQNDGVNVSLSV